MHFKDIKDLVATQLGSMGSDEGIADMEMNERAAISIYVNDGYKRVVNRYWRPWSVERTTLDNDGHIVTSSLLHPFYSLLNFGSSKEEIERGMGVFYPPVITLDPIDQLSDGDVDTGFTGTPNAILWIKYQFTVDSLIEDNDVPIVPHIVHPALADWATWKFMESGNSDKQNRARAFLNRFYDAMSELKAFGVNAFSVKNFTGVYGRR